ncbi:MAG: hypothetical protein FD164_345 [Nitrospirae bacterium]|nr:MAG: hypothetical protein FD164_345 [Nitrospirota bacterium]
MEYVLFNHTIVMKEQAGMQISILLLSCRLWV